MLLCEETLSVLDMLKPKVKLVEEACHCESFRPTMKKRRCPVLASFSTNPHSLSALRMSTLVPSFCRLILDVGNFLNYVRVSLFFLSVAAFPSSVSC